MVSKKFGFPSEKGEGWKIGIVRSVGVYVPKNSDRLFSQSELRYYSAAIFFLATSLSLMMV